ncbi:MAG: DUF4864 domain-containing protein [Rhodobacteraceae bacterium]|nr:DUF4864 domain-containing protein [Paracoccaceae bacterium]
MRSILFSVLLSIGLTGAVYAQDDRGAAIQGVISGQIEAFLADDFATAFTFAAPNIQRLFGNPDRFGSMVRNGYPMVWRPADVQFLDREDQGPFQLQKVLVTDSEGVPHVLEYQMVFNDKGWQINGVRILQAPPVGA